LLCGLTQAVYAADDGNSWRTTYDAVLVWVNFAIFAFILIKYARTPLKNFLHGQKADIEKHIEENIFDNEIVNILDIWDLLEFLHSLLVILINFLLMLSQKFIRLLFSPFLLFYYLIWWILMIIFPH